MAFGEFSIGCLSFSAFSGEDTLINQENHFLVVVWMGPDEVPCDEVVLN